MKLQVSRRHLLVLLATFLLGMIAFQSVRAVASLFDRYTHVSDSLIAPVADHHQDDLDVYRSLLRGCRERAKPYVVQEMTDKWWDVQNERAEIADLERSGLSAETITSYIENNKVKRKLTDEELGDCKAISETEVNSFFDDYSGRGWADFYKKYPNSSGMMSVSGIGFNKDRDEALVYVSTGSNGLEGVGSFVILKKEGAIWRRKKSLGLWVS